VGKDDIDVRIDGNQVTISAELKKESEEKQGRRVLRSERQYGFASRSFTLASDIDDAASTAKVENGVLELTLPKRSKASSRKLSVS
jgi:HSP20 family protein